MDKFLTRAQISDLAESNGYDFAALMAVIDVESSGHGFSAVTGNIIIQFEPKWFKWSYKDWMHHTANNTWQNNGVGNQTIEWVAFNEAFAIDADAAMQSTSIGLMQVMGFHYKALGFKTVGAMWDFAKESESNQVALGTRFIKSKTALDHALKNNMWGVFALYYNGPQYKKFSYDTRLMNSYNHYKKTAA